MGARKRKRHLVDGRKNGIDGNRQRDSTHKTGTVVHAKNLDGIIIGCLSPFWMRRYSSVLRTRDKYGFAAMRTIQHVMVPNILPKSSTSPFKSTTPLQPTLLTGI